jgi:hypothetical protein
LITKKSLSIADYKKRNQEFDEKTNGKTPEEVEQMVYL